MRDRRLTPWLLLLGPLLVFAALFVAPLLDLFLLSFRHFDRVAGTVSGVTLGNYTRLLGDSFYLGILLRTVRVAALTTLVTLIIGYPVAWSLARGSARTRAWLSAVILAPLLISVVARSFGWLVILGPNGLVNAVVGRLGLTAEPLRLLYTETAIVLGLSHVFLAFMVLSISTALQRIDPTLLRAAQSLGASPVAVFRRVVFPLSLPGVVAGALIVFTLSASAFITPALLGGPRIKVMSYLAYQQTLLLSEWPLGAAVAFVLVAVSAVSVLLSLRWVGSGRYAGVFQ